MTKNAFEIDAKQALETIQQALAVLGEGEGLDGMKMTKVVDGGRFARFEWHLPNGQIFSITAKEDWS
jgi:hypothetical protein